MPSTRISPSGHSVGATGVGAGAGVGGGSSGLIHPDRVRSGTCLPAIAEKPGAPNMWRLRIRRALDVAEHVRARSRKVQVGIARSRQLLAAAGATSLRHMETAGPSAAA